jgi:hypothetical protein
MLFAQTATYAAEQMTKEQEGAGKISGQETQKQSGQEMQKQSGSDMQKQSGEATQRQSSQDTQKQSGQSGQSGQDMQQQSGQSGQATVNFSEEMQRQNKQIWKSGQQYQPQCQRQGKSQQAASPQPATPPSQASQPSSTQQQAAGQQPGQLGQPSASQQQTGQQPAAGREQTQQATQDQGKQTEGQSAAGAGGAQTVKGQFVRVESDFYIIKDQSGKEICIPTSYGTFVDQTFSPGDTVVARLGQDGNALRIGRQSDRQTASSGSQGQEMSPQGQDLGMGATEQSSKDRGKDVAGSQGSQGQGQDLGAGTSEQATKSRDKGKQTASVVKGELLKIQGEFYTVKDTTGNEVRLHVNKETKMEIPVNVGDKVEAERTASDHAVSIKKAQDAGTGAR